MIPSAASDRAARKEGYIGDKGHEVRPSLIRKAAIDCSLFLDASDFAPSWRRWDRRDWSRFNPCIACFKSVQQSSLQVAAGTRMIC